MIAKEYVILSTMEDSFLNDLGNGYIREFIRNGAAYIDYKDSYLRCGNKGIQGFISNTIDRNDIKVLIYQSGPSDFHFNPEFFQQLKEKVFTVMTLGDTDYFFDERDIYYAQAMDLVVVYDCLSRYRFKQYGVPAISFYSSYDRDMYFKIDGVKKSIDVSFVGDIAYRKNRREYIDYIVGNGMPLRVFGTGSENGQVSLRQMVEIFNRTRINLNFTGIAEDGVPGKGLKINFRLRQMKGRIAETALCGGFVLSEYVPGIEEVFEPNREIVIFHSKEEMLEKIRYYLGHEDEREKVARAGYERALRDYEISTAIPRLIGEIEQRRRHKTRRSSEVFIDSRFIKHYTTFRFAMAAELIKLGKWNLLMEELRVIFKNKRLDFYKAVGLFLFGLFPDSKRLYLHLKNVFKH